MSYRTHLLVVANQTVDGDGLFEHLRDRAARGPVSVTIVVPQDHRAGARERLDRALARLRGAGIEAEGVEGDSDPCCAAIEAWDPGRFDEVVVSTLPAATSRWLESGLLRRIGKAIDAPVRHVVSEAGSVVTTS